MRLRNPSIDASTGGNDAAFNGHTTPPTLRSHSEASDVDSELKSMADASTP